MCAGEHTKMKFSELLLNLANKEQKPRTLGRYWASEIEQIRKGYLKPDRFFDKKSIDLLGARRIYTGNTMEAGLKTMLEAMGVVFQYQEKKEIPIAHDITLVCVADFILNDKVIETKFPFSPCKGAGIPERYKCQLECQWRAFQKPILLGKLEVPFNLTLIPYEPSDALWEHIQNILAQFHKKVVMCTAA